MSQLLLINPRKRSSRRKPRTAAQRRATAKMLAANRSRRKGRNVNARASNPAPAVRRRRRNPIAAKSHSRRRRNPIAASKQVSLSANSVMSLAKAGAVGAVGAVAVDVVYGYAQPYLPSAMQSPVDSAGSINPLYYLAKGGMAVLVGVLGRKVTRHAGNMAQGSLTVTLHDAMKALMPSGISMGSVGYMSPGAPVRNAPRLSAYTSLSGAARSDTWRSQDEMSREVGLNAYTYR